MSSFHLPIVSGTLSVPCLVPSVTGGRGVSYETAPPSPRPGVKNTMAAGETKTGDLIDGTWPTRASLCSAVQLSKVQFCAMELV